MEGPAARMIIDPCSALPAVSCVLLTSDRPAFIAQAIRYVERQTYANFEMVLVDGGRDDVFKLTSRHWRYVRARPGMSIGEMRNLGCLHAEGALCAMFDDDDWYHASRVAKQVQFWLSRDDGDGREWDAVGASRVPVYDPIGRRAGMWGLSNSLFGPTLAFTHETWAKRGYPDLSRGEEIYFCHGRSTGDMGAWCVPEWFAYVRHRTNTTKDHKFEQIYCQEHSRGLARDLRARMGDDVAFYDAMR